MQSLRIALGLVALILAWIVLVPSSTVPTPPDRAELAATGEPSSQASQPTVEQRKVETPSPNIRAIIPSPIASDAQLTRLPSVSSGAATPPAARLPGALVESFSPPDDASPQSSDAVASIAPPDAAAATDPDKPDFRLFNRPIALDTGTIQSGETTIHIAGVSSIAPEARCVEGPRSWPCGIVARTAFRGWLRGRTLICAVPPQGSIEGPLSCLMGEADVGEWLVRNGWANAEAGSRYENAANEAKAQGRGIWQFEVEN